MFEPWWMIQETENPNPGTGHPLHPVETKAPLEGTTSGNMGDSRPQRGQHIPVQVQKRLK